MKDLIADVSDEQRRGRVKPGGIKRFMDGSISNRTAWLKGPYPGSDDHGMATLTDDVRQAGYEWASRNNVQMVFHVMGDRGIRLVIDFFVDREPWMAGGVRSVRVDHATLLDKDQIRQMDDAKMTFGWQPRSSSSSSSTTPASGNFRRHTTSTRTR